MEAVFFNLREYVEAEIMQSVDQNQDENEVDLKVYEKLEKELRTRKGFQFFEEPKLDVFLHSSCLLFSSTRQY